MWKACTLHPEENENLTEVNIAVGGGKEDFIADERVNEIMKKKFGINPIYDSWSNGKIVKDPENPSNKVLKIEYTGNTQAYDYAPIFNCRLKKTLKEYSAVQLQSRVVSNTADCKYKSVVAYFARYNKITPDYYFDTSLSAKDAETEAIAVMMVTSCLIPIAVLLFMLSLPQRCSISKCP